MMRPMKGSERPVCEIRLSIVLTRSSAQMATRREEVRRRAREVGRERVGLVVRRVVERGRSKLRLLRWGVGWCEVGARREVERE